MPGAHSLLFAQQGAEPGDEEPGLELMFRYGLLVLQVMVKLEVPCANLVFSFVEQRHFI